MRNLVLGLAVAASLLLLAPDALAGGWTLEDYLKEKPKSDWVGYGVGTMTHRRITQNVVMPGQGEQKMVMEEKKTIKEITETEIVLEVETLNMGQWTTEEKREKKDEGLTPKIEEQGKETVTIAGTEYECVKKQVTWMKGEEVDETAIVWNHPEKGILKMKVSGENDFELIANELDASFTVGEHSLAGRTFEMSMTAQMGMVMKGKASMSNDVPESLVRNEIKGDQGPVKVNVVMELIAFEKK